MISERVTPELVCSGWMCTCIRASRPNTSPVYSRSSTRYPPARSTFPGAETALDDRAIAHLTTTTPLGIFVRREVRMRINSPHSQSSNSCEPHKRSRALPAVPGKAVEGVLRGHKPVRRADVQLDTGGQQPPLTARGRVRGAGDDLWGGWGTASRSLVFSKRAVNSRVGREGFALADDCVPGADKCDLPLTAGSFEGTRRGLENWPALL